MSEYSGSEREFAYQNNNPVKMLNNINNYGPPYSGGAPVPVYPQQTPTPSMIYTRPVGATVVVNQAIPAAPLMIDCNTSSSFSTVCPFCRREIMTNSIQTFNCASCLLCYMSGFFLYCCFQLCRGKEILCCDAEHRCPNCGGTVARYYSC